jgi:hypothetical protein
VRSMLIQPLSEMGLNHNAKRIRIGSTFVVSQPLIT